MKLAGRTALITGGATGIGRATAELFGAEGAVVLVLDYNETEGQAAVEAVRGAGGQAAFFRVDVRLESEVAAAFAQIARTWPCLHAVVCNAGVLKGAFKRLADLTEEDWDLTVDTNLKGTFLTCKHAAPLLARAGQAVLLLIASGAGVYGGSSSYAYAASKAGMYGLRHNLEHELGPHGTRVHVICPGGIATPLKLENIAQGAEAAGQDPAAAVARARQSLGDPVGVARVLAFLASEEGSYVRSTVSTR